MDAQLIEKLDRRRYTNLLWHTIGFTLFIPPAAIVYFKVFESKVVNTIFIILWLIGWVVSSVAVIKTLKFSRQIKKNPELGKILNNELIVHYNYKSLKLAFTVSLITIGILYLLSTNWLTAMTAPEACITIFIIILLAQNISLLVYLRK